MSEPSTRDVIAGVLADVLPGLTATWIAEDGSRRADIAETRLNLTDVAGDLIAAGVTMPAPPAVCGASAVIAGIEYVCDRERGHTEPIHECTDDVGFMQWRRGHDDAVFVVRAWTHDGSDGWPVGG